VSRPRVVCTRRFPGGALDRLATRCELWVGPEEGVPAEALAGRLVDAEALICVVGDRVDAALLDGAPRLRLVATPAAGTDHVDLAAARARGLWVCHSVDATTDATADLAWALLLAAARRVVEGDRLVREGRFHGWSPSLLLGKQVSGATLGVVGAGRIGRAVLRRAAGFGMRLCYTRTGGPLPELEASGARHRSFLELLSESDFVSLHVPLTPATRHLIDARALASLRPGAILVNTSRGPVVDEAALAAGLDAGRPLAAALDVFEAEPDVAPALRRHERVVLSPHAGSATDVARARMMEEAVAAVEAVLLDGREPAGVVVRP